MKRKSLIITGISILALFIIGYIGGGIYYQNRFLPNTSLGSLELSGDTVEEANRKLAKELHANTIAIKENKETLATVTPLALNVSVDAKETLTEAKNNQGSWGWPLTLFSGNELETTDLPVNYDATAMTSLLDSLAIDNDSRTAPVNASISNENGEFIVQPEAEGTQVDLAVLEETIIQSAVAGDEEILLEDVYLKPILTTEDEALQSAVAKLADLSETKITYTLAGEEVVVPKENIVAWLGIDGEGNPTVDKDAAKTYLDTLHEKYGTYDKKRSFKSTNRGTVELPPGEYGWSIASVAESENLASYIIAGEDITVRPEILGSGYHEDGTDIGDSYVEVDLVAQKMYMYKDGVKVFESEIVAGHPETPTPVGVFYAWDKVEDTDLIGYNPRRDADYATPVNYWVPVNWEGIGIHDASWQGSFAADEWKTNGSNGCINTPPGVMDDFFALLEIGMPVILF